MLSLAKMSLRQNLGMLAAVVAVLVGGTWLAVKLTTDYLLYHNATAVARDWARYLADNATDLESIANGEQPSSASMTFFQATQKAGQVYRYEIFNRAGYSQFASGREGIAPVLVSAFSAEATRAIQTGETIVDTREGTTANEPAYFARAYVPVVVNGRPVAVVAAYVDQTEQYNRYRDAFLLAAIGLCLLTALSFAIPAIAWFRRTKEKQEADRRIRFLAHHDALTGLTNRARLVEKLDAMLAALPARGGMVAVLFIDVDRFKEINDTFGHDGGDFLLKSAAERLRSVCRIEDEVSRLGGDEFVVVQRDMIDPSQTDAFAQRILKVLAAPIVFKEREIVTTVSIGVAVAPGDGMSSERLLKCADLALYQSKADGRNCMRFFRPEMDAALQARLALERLLRDAVARENFALHFQPIYALADRRLIGFEALIRLPADDGTLIPPLKFIPIAEEMRLIDRIGAWVLHQACRTAALWPAHLTVAVNLSPVQFENGAVSAVVADALRESGLAPHRLELEITESLLLTDSENIMAELRKIKAMGVAIVMDDFGTGYSSLSYLWRFPFDKIKIDRSFMLGLDRTGRNAETVVKTIIALGRELNMHVTVEGVETQQQLQFLDNAAGDQAQGFYFGKPVPASEIAASILADFTAPKQAPGGAEIKRLRLT